MNKIAAANAITILNRARIAFSGLDLSSIHIPDADLSFALLHFTNLTEANLERVILMQAYMADANFSKSNMLEIELGQFPMLKYQTYIRGMCYSNNGQYVAVAIGNEIVVWDITINQEYISFKEHKGDVNCIDFSPDGKFLVSGGEDKSVCLWSLESKKLVNSPFIGHADKIGVPSINNRKATSVLLKA